MKFLKVDMTHQRINVEDMAQEYIGLGGMGYRASCSELAFI